MNRLRIALQGRDTCNGTCETEGGCTCLVSKSTESQLDRRIAEQRAFAQDYEEALERRAYTEGWRWGLVNGLFAGGASVAAALFAGIHWFKG